MLTYLALLPPPPPASSAPPSTRPLTVAAAGLAATNGMQAPVLEGRETQVDMKRCRDEGEGEGVKRKQRRLHASVEAVYVYEDAGDALLRRQPRDEHSSDDDTIEVSE